MSSVNTEFKVLITGGGVAGLVLANMLEQSQINYLLLESHADIAPRVGASIGLFPNGLRILDQIGCYEPLRKFLIPKSNFHIRNSKGDPILSLPDFAGHLERRHGYPLLFFDRQWLLQCLFDNLQDKTKIIVNQKVVRLIYKRETVEAVTQKGQTFQGTVVIGADGVHSTVRKEMFRLAQENQLTNFAIKEHEKMACNYLCCFGISQNVPGWVEGDICTVLGDGVSQLAVSGPNGRVYFFFFSKLAKPLQGKDIPKFTEAMKNRFVQQHAKHPITKTVTFGELYGHQLTSTLTPLHEFVLDTWFHDRILCIGDSAHKPNPKGGQGGNAAIESCAELTNALLKMKRSRPKGLRNLSIKEITEIFSQVQHKRQERAKMIVREAHTQQALSAFENPLKSMLLYYILMPLMGHERLLNRLGSPFVGAGRLEQMPEKRRPHTVPYNDEYSTQSPRWGRTVQVPIAVCLVVLGFWFIYSVALTARPIEVMIKGN